jgi:acetylornithine/succinyldiaminopimelate/putrescine aminotransferase
MGSAGDKVIRLVPPLNLSEGEIDYAVDVIHEAFH